MNNRQAYLEWYRFAEMDLAAARHLRIMINPPIEIICYHCQQSAEKYLKGFLKYKGVTEPNKTHNLLYLLTQCIKFDSKISDILKPCSVLNPYGVAARYPFQKYDLTEADMSIAISSIEQIEKVVLDVTK